MDYVVQVNGIPFKLVISGEAYFVTAEQQNVEAGGSPLVISFDPPIGPVNAVDFGALYQAILAALG